MILASQLIPKTFYSFTYEPKIGPNYINRITDVNGKAFNSKNLYFISFIDHYQFTIRQDLLYGAFLSQDGYLIARFHTFSKYNFIEILK